MNDIEKAQSLLKGSITCVAVKGKAVYLSSLRGVRPILTWIKEGKDLTGFSLADKVVGKAAASLAVYVGAASVYGVIMSKSAVEYLSKRGLGYSFVNLTEAIKNHAGDDYCPMEKAVSSYDSPADCLSAITKKLAELTNK